MGKVGHTVKILVSCHFRQMTSLVGEQTASVSTRSQSNLYLKIPLKGDISLADTPVSRQSFMCDM